MDRIIAGNLIAQESWTAALKELLRRCTSDVVLKHTESANVMLKKVLTYFRGYSNESNVVSLAFCLLTQLFSVNGKYYGEVQKHIEVLVGEHLKEDILIHLVATVAGGYSSFLAKEHHGHEHIIQLRALNMCTTFVIALSTGKKNPRSFEFLLPTLLVCMNHESEVIRSSAMKCLDAVKQSACCKKSFEVSGLSVVKKPQTGTLKSLFERLELAEREIIVEPSSIQRLFSTFFSSRANSTAGLDKNCIESVKYIVAFITALLKTHPLNTDRGDSNSEMDYDFFSVGLNIFRLLKSMNPCALGPETYDLVKIAVESDPLIDDLFALGVGPWKDPNCPVGDKEALLLISAQRKTFGQGSSPSRQLALEVLSLPHIYNKLKKATRSTLFKEMCAVVSEGGKKKFSTDASDLSSKAFDVLTSLPFDKSIILEHLNPAKRNAEKNSTVSSVVVLESIRIRLVRAVGGEKALCEVAVSLVRPILSLMEDARDNEMELAAFCLARCLRIIREHAPERDQKKVEIDVNFIVGCTLSTENSQVRSALLALLAESGKWFPKKSLTAILPILEQIGQKSINSQKVTRDDSYTYLIFEQVTLCLFPTVSSKVVPNSKELINVISTYINSLLGGDSAQTANNLEKNLDLLQLVVQKSSPNCETLWVVIMMIMSKSEQLSELAHALLLRFEPKYQIQVLMYLTEGVHLLVGNKSFDNIDDDDDDEMMEREKSDFDLSLNEVAESCLDTASEESTAIVPLASRTAMFVSDHLGLKAFMKILLSLTTQEVEDADLQGEHGFLGLLQHLLRQLHRAGAHIAKGEQEVPVEEVQDKVRFWRVFRDQLCIILDRLNSLLSVPMFVAVVSELLQDTDAHVRHLALRQLSAKVEEEHENWYGP